MTMRRSQAVSLVGRAVVPGLLVAIALSRDQVINVQLWIAAGAVWIAGVLVWDFLVAASVEPARLHVAWRRRGGPPADRTTPKDLLALGALLADARRNPRAHSNQLRPELVELANHFVPIRHGFNPADDPERMRALLGADSWLIDPAADSRAASDSTRSSSAGERVPTVIELHRFLDVIMDEPSGMVTE